MSIFLPSSNATVHSKRFEMVISVFQTLRCSSADSRPSPKVLRRLVSSLGFNKDEELPGIRWVLMTSCAKESALMNSLS